MNAEQLRASILQLAIQGKLVEQRAEEGSAQDLFDKIQKEKQDLIKAGKLKKEKALPEISDDEIPFEIPESWKWVRLGDLSNIGKQIKVKGSEITSTTWVVELEHIEKGTGKITHKAYGTVKKTDQILFQKGSVLYGKLRPNLAKVIYADEDGVCSSEIIPLCPNRTLSSLYLRYLQYFLLSDFFTKKADRLSYGVKMPRLGTEDLKNSVISVPPLEEQKRIVKRIEELLPLVEQYGEAKEKLDAMNKSLSSKLKASILQLAIQGKLVEQRAEEGSAQELFDKIQKEKQDLIKAGKLKKEKALPEISYDEIPFEIPESWKWVRFDDISLIKSSKRVFEKDYVNDGVPFFRSKEVGQLSSGKYLKNTLFIKQELYEKIKALYGVPKKGDILITSVGTIGNTWICDERDFYYKDGNLTQLCNIYNLDSLYINYFIHSFAFKSQIKCTVSGTAQAALTIIKLKNFIIPLPPLEEQKRIVAKVEQLFSLIDKMSLDIDSSEVL